MFTFFYQVGNVLNKAALQQSPVRMINSVTIS